MARETRRGHVSEHEDWIDALAAEFEDVMDPPARAEVLRNKTFLEEFKLAPDERIIYARFPNVKLVVARTFIVLFSILGLTAGILLTVGVAFISVSPTLFFIMGLINTIILVVVFVIVVIFIPLIITAAKANRYVITDKRVVIGVTFLWRMYRSYFYDMILDVIVQQGPIARAAGAGSLVLITASDGGVVAAAPNTRSRGITMGANQTRAMPSGLRDIPSPFRVKQLVRRLILHHESGETAVPPLPVHAIVPETPVPAQVDLFPGEQVFKVYTRTKTSSFCRMLSVVMAGVVMVLQFARPLLEFGYALIMSLLPVIVIGGGTVIVVIVIASKYHARGHLYLVTDRRIVMFKKFISIMIRDAIYGMITDVSMQQMATGRFANFGTIKVMTKGFEHASVFSSLISIDGVPDAPTEKDDVFNIVLHFQNGMLFDPARYEEDLAMFGI